MTGVPFNLAAWATRHHVSHEALAELRQGMAREVPPPPPPPRGAAPEAHAQALVRLEAAQRGVLLFRNNVGALPDERGVPVRYGLANESPQLNARLKSADLIGIRSVTICPEHVGKVFGQFVSRECKPAGWRFTGTPREVAQEAWANLILSHGGDAAFATGPGSL